MGRCFCTVSALVMPVVLKRGHWQRKCGAVRPVLSKHEGRGNTSTVGKGPEGRACLESGSKTVVGSAFRLLCWVALSPPTSEVSGAVVLKNSIQRL